MTMDVCVFVCVRVGMIICVLFQFVGANLLSLFWTCLYSTKLKKHLQLHLHFVTISKPRLPQDHKELGATFNTTS